MTLGRNAVFTGTTVQLDAPPYDRALPLVVLSHGSGGNAPNLSWIASAIADRGMVVIGTNHPGTTSGDSQPSETIKLWERPADLSAIIDAALEGAIPGIRVDPDAIGALGFSLGGYSVLSLAGARVDAAAYAAYCETYAGLYDCAWLQAGGVDFGTLADDPRYEQANTDARITTVVAVDPALAQAYDPGSLAQFAPALQLVNLGAAGDIPPGVDSAPIAAQLDTSDVNYVPQSGHFSFLGTCRMMGASIIRLAGEDPICDDPGARSRADIHRELQATIGDFLADALRSEPGPT